MNYFIKIFGTCPYWWTLLLYSRLDLVKTCSDKCILFRSLFALESITLVQIANTDHHLEWSSLDVGEYTVEKQFYVKLSPREKRFREKYTYNVRVKATTTAFSNDCSGDGNVKDLFFNELVIQSMSYIQNTIFSMKMKKFLNIVISMMHVLLFLSFFIVLV